MTDRATSTPDTLSIDDTDSTAAPDALTRLDGRHQRVGHGELHAANGADGRDGRSASDVDADGARRTTEAPTQVDPGGHVGRTSCGGRGHDADGREAPTRAPSQAGAAPTHRDTGHLAATSHAPRSTAMTDRGRGRRRPSSTTRRQTTDHDALAVDARRSRSVTDRRSRARTVDAADEAGAERPRVASRLGRGGDDDAARRTVPRARRGAATGCGCWRRRARWRPTSSSGSSTSPTSTATSRSTSTATAPRSPSSTPRTAGSRAASSAPTARCSTRYRS